MRKFVLFPLFFSFVLLVEKARADVPTFSSVTPSQLKTIVEGFSANVFHSNLTPASSHKTLFFIPGLELGLIAGGTRVPKINGFATEDVSYLPYASIIAGASLPFGIGLELSYLPKLTFDQLKIDNIGGALKWTITDNFWTWFPLHLGVRSFYSNTTLKYKQLVGSTDATITLDDSTWGAHILTSKKLSLIEPYAGLGFLHGSSSVATTATTFFAAPLAASLKEEADSKGFHWFLGLQFGLPLLTFGAEYHRVFESDRLLIKLSLRP